MNTLNLKIPAAVLAALGTFATFDALGADKAPPDHATAKVPNHQEAGKASPQETAGVATGLTIGAVAGGPVGAVLGAAAGAWLGDRYHRQTVARDSLGRTLDRTRGLETDISFRTGEAQLSQETIEKLQTLGRLVMAMPDVKLRIDGYADPRGPEMLNAELSRRRALAVASVLKDAGIQEERLIVEAHGEMNTSSAEGDLDGYALERRVTVRIERGERIVASAR